MSPKPSEPQLARAQDGHKANADTVIRYSREFLLECAKSPLVERPEALPPTSVWFGEITKEEPETTSNGRSKSISNKPGDRIVLGPPKMSFASSSYGGLKRSEDGLSGFKKTLDGPRENRSPRGPPSALEQGFARETIEKLSSHRLPKVTPKDISGLLSGMERRPSRPNSSTLTGSRPTSSSTSSRLGSTTRTSGQPLSASSTSLNNINSNGMGFGSKVQRSDAPEWMSYNPDSENASNDGENNQDSQVFVDDIQAWKARMKEHERREKEKETPIQNQRENKDPRTPSRADSSSSWRSSTNPIQDSEVLVENKESDKSKAAPSLDKSLGRSILSNEPIQDIDIFFSPGGIDLTKPFDSTSAFDKFLSQHAAVSATEDLGQQKPTRKADGSRFARFFAEDEPEQVNQREQVTHSAQDMPGRQLSLDQLFQAHAPISTSTAPPPPPPLGRMPSEYEILESMKVNKSPATVKPVDGSEESADAFGFSKIMAALSKPPLGNADSVTFGSSALAQQQPEQVSSNGADAILPSTQSPGTAKSLQDSSIVTSQSKLNLLDTLMKPVDSVLTPPEPSLPVSSSVTSQNSQTQGSGPITNATSPSTPSSDTSRHTSRPVQVAFGGGIPTSVYRQLSGKTEGQRTGSPLIRPLSSVTGLNANGGSSPSLSSPSTGSPRQFNPQATVPPQQVQPPQQQSSSQVSSNIQQSPQLGIHQHQQSQQQSANKNFGSYNQGPGPVLHSPAMDPRLSGMYGSGGPSPMGGHGHVMENEPSAFFNGMPMQRPAQGAPPQFAQQMPPFSQQMHVSGPGDFMPPHPSQFVGMPPFGAPMHPGMFPMNPVEMLMHRGPGGPPPRPMPGMAGPSHFVPNNFGHPMNNMPHPGQNAYLFGIPSPGRLEAYSLNLSNPSAPQTTFISATTSTTSPTEWSSQYSLGCYAYIGDSSPVNSPIDVIQFGNTIQAVFYPNGTWVTTIESGAEASVNYASSNFYSIVGSTNKWNWILANANAKSGNAASIGPWIDMRTGTTLQSRTQNPTIVGSDLLLTVGAIAPDVGDFGNGYLFTFGQSGSSGTVFRAVGDKHPDQNVTATEAMVTLTAVHSVNMNNNTLTPNAIPVISSFAALILDKGPGGTISILSIDPRSSTFTLTKSTVSSLSPLFLNNQSATSLNSKIVVYGGTDQTGAVSNSVHVFDVIAGTWSGPGLVDPAASPANPSKTSGAVIGGIAAGAVVLIVAVCIIIWRVRSNKAKLANIRQQELDSIDKTNKDKMIKLLDMETKSYTASEYNDIEGQKFRNESSLTLTEAAAPSLTRSSGSEKYAHRPQQQQQRRQSSKSQVHSRHASTRSVGQISLYSSASSIYLVDSPSSLPPTPMVPPAYSNNSFESHRTIQRHYAASTSLPSTPSPRNKKPSSYAVAVPDEYDDRQPLHRHNTDELSSHQQSSLTAGSTGSPASFNLSFSGEGGSLVLQEQPGKTRQQSSKSRSRRTSRDDGQTSISLPSSPTSQRYPSDVATTSSTSASNNQVSSSGKQKRTKKAPTYPRSKTDPAIEPSLISPTTSSPKSLELQYDDGSYKVEYKELTASSRQRQRHQSPRTPTTPISGSTAFSPTSPAFPPSPKSTSYESSPNLTPSDPDSRFTEAFPMPPRVKGSKKSTRQQQRQQYQTDWHQEQELIYQEQQRLGENNGFIPQSPKTPKLGSLPRPIPRENKK
ncbi:hypothetical protein BGZ46_010004 [Entomortierella lignicola]|nr:hypothetical protein BGZ46_010004 [Entomortierella lignicola]